MNNVLGLGACALSSVCFGSMYVAVRKFDVGDGVFVQWIVCTAIFIVGMFVYAATEFPQFQPFAMIGGLLWAVGNLTALPIIKVIGLGMGILVWGTTNCVVGWATGRFGLFGTPANPPSLSILNYVGLCMVIVGGVLFSFVRPSVRAPSRTPPSCNLPVVPGGPSEDERSSLVVPMENVEPPSPTHPTLLTHKTKRILALIFSALAGVCYGLTFFPVIYIQNNPEKFKNPSKDAIDYAFSHFSGIFLTSTFVLVVYLVYTQNSPYVNGKIILPALFAGLLWAIAQLAWFVANDLLSQAITFPINAMLPGVIATLWSVFYFKEIEGANNLRLLSIAVGITITGAALVGLSK